MKKATINCEHWEDCADYDKKCSYCRNNKVSHFEPIKRDKPDLGALRHDPEEPDTNYDLCGDRKGAINCWAYSMRYGE